MGLGGLSWITIAAASGSRYIYCLVGGVTALASIGEGAVPRNTGTHQNTLINNSNHRNTLWILAMGIGSSTI